jgi:hypothetical protein
VQILLVRLKRAKTHERRKALKKAEKIAGKSDPEALEALRIKGWHRT